MIKINLKSYKLELEHTFTISRESYNSQNTLIVEFEENGFKGLGEATSNPYYGISVEQMIEDISSIRSIIESSSMLNPNEFWEQLYSHLQHNMFALCALDLAFTDLYTNKKGVKLYNYWGYTTDKNPKTNFTIGIDTIENMVGKLKEKPWPIYKIKLGTPDDIKIIEALRKHTNAVFRIDANCAWTVNETIQNSIELKKLGVEFIEQPLKANDWEGHKKVFQNSQLPIIADESCLVEADVLKCKDHFHGINVKLVKCGGLNPARRMLIHARKIGLKTMVGCMTESSIGISAIAHLLPLLNFVDMDGALLLKRDIAQGVVIKQGNVLYAERNGIGARFKK